MSFLPARLGIFLKVRKNRSVPICLKYKIVPFIIEDNLTMFYYRGLKEWDNEKGCTDDGEK